MALKSSSRVSQCPYSQYIYDCLQSKWSSPRIYRELCRKHGPGEFHVLSDDELWSKHKIPSEQSIRRYAAKWIPDVSCLPSFIIDKKLEEIDFKVDTLGELARAIIASRTYLRKALETQEKMPVPMDTVERALRLHAKLVCDYQELAFQLGVDTRADERAPLVQINQAALTQNVIQTRIEQLPEGKRDDLFSLLLQAERAMVVDVIPERADI